MEDKEMQPGSRRARVRKPSQVVREILCGDLVGGPRSHIGIPPASAIQFPLDSQKNVKRRKHSASNDAHQSSSCDSSQNNRKDPVALYVEAKEEAAAALARLQELLGGMVAPPVCTPPLPLCPPLSTSPVKAHRTEAGRGGGGLKRKNRQKWKPLRLLEFH